MAEVRGTVLTDTTDDQGVDWGTTEAPSTDGATWSPEDYEPAKSGPLYPEYPPLAEAPISINFKVTGEPMITVRGWDATQITTVLNDLTEGGVWANIAAAQADLRTQGQFGAGLGPVTPVSPQGPPPGPAQGYAPGPQAGPPFGPNVSVPSAPGYVGPPQGQQSYQSPPQQGGNWGGGGGGGNYQNNNQGGGGAQPQAQPPGWLRTNARSGPGFDNWKIMREQQKDYLRGKIKWGGKSDYWIEPSIGQWLAQQGWPVTQ
jgi:hypothetical protein